MNKTLRSAFGLLSVLTLLSCGSDTDNNGSSSESTTTTAGIATRAAFVAEATALCEPLMASRQELAARFFPSPTDPPTVEQMQAFYAAFGPVFTQMVDDFANLTPAPEDQAAFDAVVPVTRQVVETITQAATDSALAQELMDTDEAKLHEPDAALVALGVPADC